MLHPLKSVALVSLAVAAMALVALPPAAGAQAPADAGPALQTLMPEPGLTAPPLGDSERGLSASPVPAGGSPKVRANWSLNLHAPGAGFPYTPTLYDCDHDGADEIFLTGGNTFGIRGDGTFLPGWPTTEHMYMGYGTNDQKPGPSAADVDGDGDSEVMWSERDWYAGSAHMWCFNGRNFDGSNMPNFPQVAPGGESNALDVPFVLGDTDGDGDLEAWGPHTLGNNFVHYRISAFDHLGTRLFTHDMDPAENALSLYFGDLDGNGVAEMFTVAMLGQNLRLHAFTPDGNEWPGHPVQLHNMSGQTMPFGPPIVADLDRDGDLEILLGTWTSGGTRIRAFHHDGTVCAGFPIAFSANHQLFYIAMGDLTGDGVPELISTGKILTSDYRIHALDVATGTILPGWPYQLPDWPTGCPTVADVDNDGYQDVCVTTMGGEVRAVNRKAELIAGYPLTMSNSAISGASVGDIDGDGLFELVAATWDGWVYAWDTPGEARFGRADWPMRAINARNTGVFGDFTGTADVVSAGTREAVRLSVHPNPVSSWTRLRLAASAVPHPEAIAIYDTAGRLIELLPAQGETVLWRPSAAVPAGAYFARLQGVTESRPTTILVIR